MRYIGIDYGTQRIGIALSDESGEFAFPHSIVSAKDAVQVLADLVRKEQVESIICGYSVASNGVENDLTKKAHAFMEQMQKEISIPWCFEREDFSSVEAHRFQVKAGSRDDSAAAIILQRFLDKQVKK